MKELANRLAMQHLVNAYAQETAKIVILEKYQQNSNQISFSQGLTLLVISIECLNAQVLCPLSYVSVVGRHRLAQLPQIFIKGQIQTFSSVAIATLLLEDLIQYNRSQSDLSNQQLDSASLVERWIQSRDALHQFLELRKYGQTKSKDLSNHKENLKNQKNDLCKQDIENQADHDFRGFDRLIELNQNYIQTEQALLLGHSMHPAPKSRTGFIHEDWLKYSPEAQTKTQLVYWLVAPEYISEDSALSQPISKLLKDHLQWHLTEFDQQLIQQYEQFKILPLHPWQARYLQSKDWFKQLKQQNKLIDLGEKAWAFAPTTSVRTLAAFDAPWQVKPSLSVMVTNSVRVNLEKECHRGVMTHQLWHSEAGQNILAQCPTLKAVNDPAWIALNIDGQMINETICIFREQPFNQHQQITCIASLCQDHPNQNLNRFNTIFEHIGQTENLDISDSSARETIALNWFKQFLEISLKPLMYLYHRHGMAFESHQQNVLVELEQGVPKTLWLRDNQGFYYIEEYAQDVLKQFPALKDKAHAVGSKEFVDERFSYYFFGNTLFGLINAIGVTSYIAETRLIDELRAHLEELYQRYPNSSLIHGLLFKSTLPYKGNLLTRLYELDELTASVDQQSVYIQLNNPLWIQQKGVAYA